MPKPTTVEKKKKCPSCREYKPINEVIKRKDPYAYEIHDRTIYRVMCLECVQDRAGDI